MSVLVREAYKADGAALRALALAAFNDEATSRKVEQAIDQFAEEIETDDQSIFTRYWVAEIDGKVVGMCGLSRMRWVGPHMNHLGWFFVSPELQGQRIGSTLLRYCIDIARKRETRWLFVETDNNAEAAQRLYHRFGFREQARVDDYWADGSQLVLLGLRTDAKTPSP